MTRSRMFRLRLAILALTLLPALSARAEITTGTPGSPAATRIPADQPVKAECWQQGVKILDQTGLWGVNMGSLLRDQAILLQSHPDGSPDLYILAVGQATCVVRRQ